MDTATLNPKPIPESGQESARVTEVRGPNIVQIRKVVLRHGGEEAWKALLARVSGPCRAQFEKPLGLYDWVQERHFTELSQAYILWSGRHDAGKAGQAAAQEEFTTLHRWMLKMMTPGFLLASIPRFFAHYTKGGCVVVDESGPGHAQISVWADGFFPEWYSPGLTSWTQRALELTGAQGVQVEYQEPMDAGPESCRHIYRLSWQA
ncbi:MAG: hypothetical protein IPQ13_02675 [Holophagaceae bacterium]|nr:hypothetical protein [Holophagaceae bacterium]